MGWIYRFYCAITKKNYIGQTTLEDPYDRKKQHIDKALAGYSNCRALSDAICEHGPDTFTFEVLLQCNDNDLNMFETKMVALYNTLEPAGYNSTKGGSAGKKSEAAKLAVTNGLLKRNETYEYKRTNEHSILISKKYVTAYTGDDGSRGFRYRPFKGDNKIITSKTRAIEDLAKEMLEYVARVEAGEVVDKIHREEGNEPGVQKITLKGVDQGYRYVWMVDGKERAKTWQSKKLTMDEKRAIANEYSRKECSSETQC